MSNSVNTSRVIQRISRLFLMNCSLDEDNLKVGAKHARPGKFDSRFVFAEALKVNKDN